MILSYMNNCKFNDQTNVISKVSGTLGIAYDNRTIIMSTSQLWFNSMYKKRGKNKGKKILCYINAKSFSYIYTYNWQFSSKILFHCTLIQPHDTWIMQTTTNDQSNFYMVFLNSHKCIKEHFLDQMILKTKIQEPNFLNNNNNNNN